MKKSKKIAMIAAAVTIAAGTIISAAAFTAMEFDIKKISTVNYETNTYNLDERFADISVEGAECNVRLIPSDNNSCKVICYESDKIHHSVEVKDNTLKIQRKDSSKWYDNVMNICWEDMVITVCLPENQYSNLKIKSASGDVEIPDNFTFDKAVIDSTSGDVNFMAAVKNDLSVETVSGNLFISNAAPEKFSAKSTSGDMKISSVKSGAEFTAETTSGDIKMTDCKVRSIYAESTSGEIIFSDCYALDNVKIESVSGDVEMYNCDADSLWIKTTSGDVSGTIVTEKVFITDTSSGDVSVPKSVTGGKCEIITTSGDIEFKIN